LITSGKLAHVNCKKTVVCSRVSDNRYVVTTDEFGEAELSDVVDKKALLNADLYELAVYHQRRLAQSDMNPIPFSGETVCDAFGEMEAQCTHRLVEMGYARFIDPEQTRWRYSLKGAWKIAWSGHRTAVRVAKGAGRRAKIKRPGHRKYAESTMRGQQPATAGPRPAPQPRPCPPELLRHSRCGIASFLLALGVGILLLAATAWVAVSAANQAASRPHVIWGGLVLLLSVLGVLTGLTLGIVGLVQPHRKRVFAILGVATNGLLILFIAGLVLLGIAMASVAAHA
jgi:hypothetical protein